MYRVMKSNKIFIVVLCVFMLCSGAIIDSLINVPHIKMSDKTISKDKSSTKNLQSDITNYLVETDEVAVVNLDEGIKTGGKKIYYAQNFITLPSEHFHITSLDEARNGMENGIYGAYIVIPATFSQSVESINYEPQKAIITYTVNADNAASHMAKVINDINTFASIISENITYIYVSAIMKEYHVAQDNTKLILKNDNLDLENINNIYPEKLIEKYSQVDTKNIDYKPTNIDISKYEINHDEASNSFSSSFNKIINENTTDFKKIKNDNKYTTSAIDSFQEYMENINLLKDSNGKAVYSSGIDNIRKFFENHQDKIENSNNIFKEIFTKQNTQTKNILDNEIKSHLATESNAIKHYVNLELNTTIMQTYKTAFDREYENFERNGMEKMRKYLRNIIIHELDFNSNQKRLLLEKLATASDAIFESATMSNATKVNSFNRMMRHVHPSINIGIKEFNPTNEYLKELNKLELTDLSSIKSYLYLPNEQLEKTLKQNLEDTIESSISKSILELNKHKSNISREYEKYINTLEDYDPYAHLNQSYMSNASNEIRSRLHSALGEVRKKQNDDERQVYDLMRLADENTRELEKNINDSNELTKKNVVNIVNELKNKKESTKNKNSELMETFSKKLSYTRVGSIGNRDAYNFISDPVVVKSSDSNLDISDDTKITAKNNLNYRLYVDNKNNSKYIKIIIGIGVTCFFILILKLIYIIFIEKKKQEE